ncbi:MAG: GIY-YIG nuclease family protein [Candidatus Symbiobacter sp.]|nr:GIY-YIG nuclease family protein [Candidatus Symbiobacter sp.]
MSEIQPPEFEASQRYAYWLAKYNILPKVIQIASEKGDQPFILRDIMLPLIEDVLSEEQKSMIVTRKNGKRMMLDTSVKSFVAQIVKQKHVFEKVSEGVYKNKSDDEEIEEIEEDSEEFDGTIYAYSFPMIIKPKGEDFPIKIGRTEKDVDVRIGQQSNMFEPPKILEQWPVNKTLKMEQAIHKILDYRDKKREAPGKEWFDTTIAEITEIIDFIRKG